MSSNEHIFWSIEFSRTGVQLPVHKATIRGVEFNVGLSPFEVPMQIQLNLDQDKRRLTIVLDYANREAEKLDCDHEDELVVIYVGQQSSRVQRIEVTLADPNGQPLIDRVRVNVQDAAKMIELEAQNAPDSIRDNYSVVAKSLRSEALLANLLA